MSRPVTASSLTHLPRRRCGVTGLHQTETTHPRWSACPGRSRTRPPGRPFRRECCHGPGKRAPGSDDPVARQAPQQVGEIRINRFGQRDHVPLRDRGSAPRVRTQVLVIAPGASVPKVSAITGPSTRQLAREAASPTSAHAWSASRTLAKDGSPRHDCHRPLPGHHASIRAGC